MKKNPPSPLQLVGWEQQRQSHFSNNTSADGRRRRRLGRRISTALHTFALQRVAAKARRTACGDRMSFNAA
jgi:hypothetical protein